MTPFTTEDFTHHFTQFLQVWLDWSEGPNGASDIHNQHEYLNRFSGLCGNFRLYLMGAGVVTDSEALNDYDTWLEFNDMLKTEFRMSGLDGLYPFGYDAYMSESRTYTHHLNPARLAWVRQYLKNKESV